MPSHHQRNLVGRVLSDSKFTRESTFVRVLLLRVSCHSSPLFTRNTNWRKFQFFGGTPTSFLGACSSEESFPFSFFSFCLKTTRPLVLKGRSRNSAEKVVGDARN